MERLEKVCLEILDSFIMEKVNSYPDSSLGSDNQQNTIMRYLSIYLTKTLEKETRLVNKEGKFTDITLITNDDKLDMVNLILRLRLILSVYKPFLMTMYSKELSIINLVISQLHLIEMII